MKLPARDYTGQKAANRITRQLRLLGPQAFPVDIDFIARNCHSNFGWKDPVTDIYGDAWDSFEGMLERNEDGQGWRILYNKKSPPERQLFTKAHELGHYIIHRKDQTIRCSKQQVWERDSGEVNIEAQANQFASALLMPADDVRQQIDGAEITLDFLGQLRLRYGVSLEAMAIKFVEITDRRAVFIYWDNGYMRYCVPSTKARMSRARYLNNQQLIEPPAGTVAADTSVAHEREGVEVEANLWFKTEPPGTKLREMKTTSEKLERVLTLLILPSATAPWERDEDESDAESIGEYMRSGHFSLD
jgi:hypothetical protein